MFDKIKMLSRIGELYQQNQNIIRYLKNEYGQKENTVEDILISYDFQAGTSSAGYEKNPGYFEDYVPKLAKTIDNLSCNKRSIFECGVGEANMLVALSNKMAGSPELLGGADISWSRIKAGQQFASKYIKGQNKPFLCVGDMFQLPLADNAIDIVFTCEAVEPNAGHEREILQELYRVTNEYLILLEPAYDLADEESRRRMEYHGYVRNLYNTAKELNFNIESWELYGMNRNPLNPVGMMIIRKNAGADVVDKLCCPITKTPLKKLGNAYFSKESLLAYPIVNEVPCLTASHAIVATKMEEY